MLPRTKLSINPAFFFARQTCIACLHVSLTLSFLFPTNSQEERYKEIADEMKHMLIRVGWKDTFLEKSVPILPISGWMGDNLIKKSENMTWYKGKEVETLDGRKVQVGAVVGWSVGRCCCPGL